MKARLLVVLTVSFVAMLASASTVLAASERAAKPTIAITNLRDGMTVNGSTVTVRVAVSNFKLVPPVLLAPAKWGTIPLLPGNQGHIHYVLDSLANLVLSRDVVVQTSHAWTGVTPGRHTIIAYLATSQHAQFPGTRVATVHINVAPAPRAAAARQSGPPPSIKITAADAKVGGSSMDVFVHVAVSRFKLVRPILRPPSQWSMIPLLPGNQGHIHYVLDSMANFRLTRDVVPDLVHNWSNVSPGWHTITAYLANSQHQQFPGAQPSSTRIYVPSVQKAVRVRSLPVTGGAGDEHHAAAWLALIAGVVAMMVGLGGRAYSRVRSGSTPCAKR